MGVGKYSPTVSEAYRRNQDWWRKNGGGEQEDINLDKDGYDSYGYSGKYGDGPDRAGNTELDYMLQGEWFAQGTDEEDYVYPLAERTYSDWGVDENGLPKRR